VRRRDVTAAPRLHKMRGARHATRDGTGREARGAARWDGACRSRAGTRGQCPAVT
jgi:hypothetical protein